METNEELRVARHLVLDSIETWDDAFQFFDELMDGVRGTMHPVRAFSSLYIFYAFIQAVRQLPAERDVKPITERMMEVFLGMKGEMFGPLAVDVILGNPDSAMYQLSFLAEAIAEQPTKSTKFN